MLSNVCDMMSKQNRRHCGISNSEISIEFTVNTYVCELHVGKTLYAVRSI